MKISYLISLLLFGLLTTANAQAEKSLFCASKKNAEIYFTEGQVLLYADIVNPEKISDINLIIKGEEKLGSQTSTSSGKTTDKYIRFDLDDSLFCDYRVALPKNFHNQSNTVLFLDAYCEEGYEYSVQMNCSIR